MDLGVLGSAKAKRPFQLVNFANAQGVATRFSMLSGGKKTRLVGCMLAFVETSLRQVGLDQVVATAG